MSEIKDEKPPVKRPHLEKGGQFDKGKRVKYVRELVNSGYKPETIEKIHAHHSQFGTEMYAEKYGLTLGTKGTVMDRSENFGEPCLCVKFDGVSSPGVSFLYPVGALYCLEPVEE